MGFIFIFEISEHWLECSLSEVKGQKEKKVVIFYFWLLVEFYRKSALSKLFLKLKTLPYIQRASPVARLVENPLANAGDVGSVPGSGR